MNQQSKDICIKVCSLYQVISLTFTHKQLSLDLIGRLHVPFEDFESILLPLKKKLHCNELFYLSTCNRVELVLVFYKGFQAKSAITENVLSSFMPHQEMSPYIENCKVYYNDAVAEHLIEVAASVDSVIIGEREIITQVRKASEQCRDLGLSGDVVRILIKSVIETSKKVYTKTSIAQNPVSIVSLAYRELKRLNLNLEAKILVVGAGITNTTLCRFLKKHGFKHFYIFNRSIDKAKLLAEEIQGQAFEISQLDHFKEGFDVLICCTAANHVIINPSRYKSLLDGDLRKKIIIDLAIPRDVEIENLSDFATHYISIHSLKELSEANIKIRKKELDKVYKIIRKGTSDYRQMQKERNVELAMKSVPEEIKKIKHFALNELYKTDLDQLDPHSRVLLDKVVNYLEKKYISGPMKMAKEIILSEIKENEV